MISNNLNTLIPGLWEKKSHWPFVAPVKYWIDTSKWKLFSIFDWYLEKQNDKDVDELRSKVYSLVIKKIDKILSNWDYGFYFESILYDWDLKNYIDENLDREYLFISKVLLWIQRILENSECKHIVLFDIDKTIWKKIFSNWKQWELVDSFRPSFFLVVDYLKRKYLDQIDFWILSARKDVVEDFELGSRTCIWKLWHIFNGDYVFSSSAFSQELCEDHVYWTDKATFKQPYSQKANAFHYIKEISSWKQKFILIDDVIEWGVFEQRWEWISVMDCSFQSEIIWLKPNDYY